jgi:hypothetical protein
VLPPNFSLSLSLWLGGRRPIGVVIGSFVSGAHMFFPTRFLCSRCLGVIEREARILSYLRKAGLKWLPSPTSPFPLRCETHAISA